MRVILTGGAGFVGSHVADQLLARGHEVAIVDNLSTGKKENVPDGAILYERDIRDGHETLDLLSITKIDIANFSGVLYFMSSTSGSE